MSELYFENVIEKGNLYLDHILYEFEDEPILFLCKDKDGNRYLCHCAEIRGERRWVLIEISLELLKSLIEDETDIASAFLSQEKAIQIRMDLQGCEKSSVIDTAKMDRLDLPKEGTLVRCDKEKAREYLHKSEKEMLLLPGNPLSIKGITGISESSEGNPYRDSQRPLAPHGSTRPLEDTGRPISSAITFPWNLFISVPRRYASTAGCSPVV